jgi:hypothetical protein
MARGLTQPLTETSTNSPTTTQFLFLLEISFRQLYLCYFVAPSLMRGQVCNLFVQLLLGLARAVTLGPKSRRTQRPYFTVLFETPPTWRARFLYIYLPRNRMAQLYPQALGSLFVTSYDSLGLQWRYSNPPPHGCL